MLSATLSGSKRRIVDHLKRDGPTTAIKLAGEFGLTDVAVRQHLIDLESTGLVRQERILPVGRGRPTMLWSLADNAAGLFPDAHGELVTGLIEAIHELFGEEGLAGVLDKIEVAQVAEYRRALPAPSNSLKSKVEALAATRTKEGYMADATPAGADGFILTEHHCPVARAAGCCAGICAAELSLFRAVLGDGVSVERTEHLLAGQDRCSYRIESKPAKDDWQCY